MAISSVATNIITGFLGVGKTTAILHLLRSKPEHERWAILVNEFGDIGIDGGIFQGNHSQQDGVFIREVPGGCMCCTAGLPMQVALNLLLAKAKPHRLLIEPTGLGHPKEVLAVLSSEHYQKVLHLQNTITLVDARNITKEAYTQHDIFNQQLDIADVIVANKFDQYGEDDMNNLKEYLKNKDDVIDRPVYSSTFGELSLSWLEESSQHKPSVTSADEAHHHDHQHTHHSTKEQPDFPECGYLTTKNQGEGFITVGWRFSPEWEFDRAKLFHLLSGLKSERTKGIFITEQGVFGYNQANQSLSEFELDETPDSRIEIITQSMDKDFENKLIECGIYHA
ncbi:GTP-binding protein [Pleionea sp. CnH1-48]|uniref:CobW family GTP-binding protein n=1 Tax=Pleionea sp. CnH1-48 TaxID=2954494 RepID=UPI00209849C4|nr:CobW family GTP-binding protein [Pleionea sp. CnH1-48]MCO7223051.1 GTP-binding protein [Pleionea sp. CnH1-48]